MTGVRPLVCCVCEQVVGVINAEALGKMLKAGEAYVCSTCMELEPQYVEGYLAGQLAEDYMRLVAQVLKVFYGAA